MPELPEVETIAADLRREVTGRRITSVHILRDDMLVFPHPKRAAELLRGHIITGVGRLGKFMLLRDGGIDVLVHLGMTGHLRLADASAPLAHHTHFIARLDDGRELRFDDARRFGRLAVGTRDELIASGALPRLGPDALTGGITGERLATLLRSRAPLKACLLDQSRLAGLGNIYADESCFRAGLRPDRIAASLTPEEAAALARSIRTTLRLAVRNRGSSIDDYRDVWNAKGKQQERLLVYGRSGKPCTSCGETLSRGTVAGRTTVWCGRCQV